MTLLTFRTIGLQEMVFPMEVAHKEGWNPGLYDGVAFFQAQPDGFYLAEREGGVVGGISVVNYEEKLAFIGSHFVLPPFRRQGFGRALWEYALERAAGMTAVIYGLPEGQSFYSAYGFQHGGSVIRYSGRVFAAARLSNDVLSAQDLRAGWLAAYDRQVFGLKRENFLNAWLETPGLETACCIKEGKIVGWGAIRRCRRGWRLGPVFADQAIYGEEILRHLACKTVGEEVFLDLPEANHQAIRLAFAVGMIPHKARIRMYKGEMPAQPWEKVYGITTLDIG